MTPDLLHTGFLLSFTAVKKRVIHFLKNKYALAASIFLFWVLFVNDIDLIYIIKSQLEVRNLTEEVKEMTRKNAEAKEALHDLTTNLSTLEKFAREQYYMKRDNEEVFVFKERAD